MKLSFGGSEAGTCWFEIDEKGNFSGEAAMTLAGQKIAMKISGTSNDKGLLGYTLQADQAGRKVEVVLTDGKVKATDPSGTREVPVTGLPKPYFANFFPQTFTNVFRHYDAKKGGKQSMEVILLDGASVLKVDVEPGPPRSTAVHRGLATWKVTVAAVNVEYVQEPSSARIVAMDVPAQGFQAVAVGYEDVLVDPTTLDKDLSQPTLKPVVERGVKMKMRDGAQLVADIARPEPAGRYPVILLRTPYGRAAQLIGVKGEWWARRGYVVVAQDCRGREDSEGEWDPMVNEKNDGYDTIDWISKQPWCDGNIGMIGGSYGGLVQWQAAVMGHPALKCIVPQVSPPDAFFNIPYDHGVFFLFGNLWWANLVRDKKTHLERAGQMPDWSKMSKLPLTEVDKALFGVEIPFYRKWLARDTASAWQGWNYQAELSKVKIPALHISGWWDGDGIGTKMNWQAMARTTNRDQYLIYGPWTHAFNTTSKIGDWDFGSGAILELDSVYLRWFDTWLKRKPAKLAEKLPRVQVFVTGANEWRLYDGWPASKSVPKAFYLSSDGPANGDSSLGRLEDAPPAKQEPDRYLYNPADVTVPKALKASGEAMPEPDLKVTIEPENESVLVYKTAAFGAPLEVGGPIQAELYFSSTAEDCDLFAAVVDIDPEGVMRQVGMGGKIRARYLSGWSKPSALQPGKIYKATLDLWDFAHRFGKGHRLGLVISSGAFPVFARNLGYFEPIATATKMVAQVQTIYHDARHPSRLTFRVLPPK